jgi:hypothetical protein
MRRRLLVRAGGHFWHRLKGGPTSHAHVALLHTRCASAARGGAGCGQTPTHTKHDSQAESDEVGRGVTPPTAELRSSRHRQKFSWMDVKLMRAWTTVALAILGIQRRTRCRRAEIVHARSIVRRLGGSGHAPFSCVSPCQGDTRCAWTRPDESSKICPVRKAQSAQ